LETIAKIHIIIKKAIANEIPRSQKNVTTYGEIKLAKKAIPIIRVNPIIKLQ